MTENKVISIEEMKALSTPIIEIPNFDNTGTINVRVRKPRILQLAQKGEIPNHLISIATQMITGKAPTSKKKEDPTQTLKDAALMTELYASVCLVEPSYEEFKEIMTDDQGDAIFMWALGQVNQLDSFRKDKADDKHNTDGKEVPNPTE